MKGERGVSALGLWVERERGNVGNVRGLDWEMMGMAWSRQWRGVG